MPKSIYTFVVEKKRQIDKYKYIIYHMKEIALEALGLNTKESQIYLSNLKLGSALVQDISKSAKINRTSTYDLLANLEKKGFVSYTITSGKRYYQATNPDRLLTLLKEKETLVKKSLPELKSLVEFSTKKPNVEVFVGINGIKTIFESILEESTSFYCIASKIHLSNLFKYYFPQFVKRRIKKKIAVKIITDDKPYDKNAKYKLIKKSLKTATWIYNGKIVMISLEENEPIGILIEENNFYQTHKIMFEILWDNL